MWVYWVILALICVLSYFIVSGFLPKDIALITSTTTFILGLLFPILQSKLLLWQTALLISVLLLLQGYLVNKYLQRCTKQLEPCSSGLFTLDNEIHKDSPILEIIPKLVELPESAAEDVLQLESGGKTGQGKDLGEISTNKINNEQRLDQTAVEEVALVFSDDKVETHEPELENSPGQEEVYIVDMQEKETKDEVLPNESYQSIMAKGLLYRKNQEFSKAIHCFRKVIFLNPPPELLYLVINELSSVYQYLGFYSMASDIIELFIKQPTLKSHPGAENLRQKMKFINTLNKLLIDCCPENVPYEQIPKTVLKEAFRKFKE